MSLEESLAKALQAGYEMHSVPATPLPWDEETTRAQETYRAEARCPRCNGIFAPHTFARSSFLFSFHLANLCICALVNCRPCVPHSSTVTQSLRPSPNRSSSVHVLLGGHCIFPQRLQSRHAPGVGEYCHWWPRIPQTNCVRRNQASSYHFGSAMLLPPLLTHIKIPRPAKRAPVRGRVRHISTPFSSASLKRRQDIRDGRHGFSRRSQRWTVSRLTPSFVANSSWVRASLARRAFTRVRSHRSFMPSSFLRPPSPAWWLRWRGWRLGGHHLGPL